MNKFVGLILFLLMLSILSVSTAAFSCNNGKLGQSTCEITQPQNITGETITDSNTDIIVKSGGRLYTNHKTPSNSPTASISLTSGDFIVESGGAVHANINISAFNVRVKDGGVIDATGLGWQAASTGTGSCKFGQSPDGYCLGGGPAGGSGGDGNSNTGAGGAGYGGKGGSYRDSSVSYTATGGGRGSTNGDLYGNPENPTSFGSGGGAEGSSGPDTIVDIEAADGHGKASNYQGNPDLVEAVQNATFGDGDTDDPDDDPVDGDRWISTEAEYRKNNPNDILMGSGGGKIKLVGSNKINISGNVLSNGLDAGGTGAGSYAMGAGSGGSVLISAGGIFGNGKIKAKGGSYSEWLDGDDSNTGSKGVSSGGGGGRIYYEYSIQDQSWNISAKGGQGVVPLSKGFAKNSNKQDQEFRDRFAKDGTARSQIAFSANTNDTIINPRDPMKVNGTASSTVKVYINGTKVGETEPRASDGFYNLTVEGLDINKTNNFGNYTMEISSTISTNTITETFQISHRNIQVTQNSDYIKKPGEQFTVSSTLHKIKEDGSGGSQKTDYSGQAVNFDFFSESNNLRSSTPTTNSTGGFSLSDTVPTTEGRKYYTTQDENQEGITGFDRKNISWMKLNDTIVDPGQSIQINGSAHNTVNFEIERPDGTFLDKGSIDPNSNGYFEVSKQSLNRSIIDSEEDLGNYTLRVQTKLNRQVRTETWEISHREIEIDNNPDFFLKPDEDLQFSNFTYLIKEDGAGGKTRADYASQDLSFNYFNQSNNLNSTTVTTNSTGGFSIFQNIQPTAGLKRFTIETENQNGIDDTIYDNDIYNINNRSIGWVSINDSIVDPGQQIQINGSAYSQVTLELEKPDGSYIQRSSITPEADGFFEVDRQVLTRSILENYQDLGNYTLRINTSLNGQTRTEKFNLSYRELEYYHNMDYFRRPGEQFTISGSANLTKEDGAGGSETVPFTNGDFNFLYFNGENKLRDTTKLTDSSGEFSVTDNMESTEGKKYYVIEDVNENGITDLRSDNDLKNSSRKNLGLVSIDDYIVNSGEEVKVNGTAYNNVEITFNGTEVSGSPVTPNASTGFFNNTFTVPEIPDTSGFGNQTLRVNTTLNGKERSEEFDVSLRGIRFDLSSGYPRRVGPEDNFTISGFAHKYVSDGSGGSEAVDYAGETVTITYRDNNGEIQNKTDTTNSTGGFEIQDFESPLNAGDREIEISTINDEDIRHDRVETVKTRIRVENSSTTSPSKRLFKDSNLEQTRFINPTQDVEFSVNTRKSLDFVKSVYANVTLPDGSPKQVELNAKGVLGKRIDSASEWDSGNTSHLTHSDIQNGIDSDQLRLGYEKNISDELLLNMPMETSSGDVKDVSGQGKDASVNGTVIRQASGVFSTNATSLEGGYLEIQDSQALNFASNFTLSTWINTGDTGTVYSRETGLGGKVNPALRLLSDGTLEMEIKGGSASTVAQSSSVLNNGNWHHIAARYNETHISVYVDGNREDISSVNEQPVKFSKKPRIGDTTKDINDKLNGRIDQFKAFNQSVQESRIEKLAQREGSFQTDTINTDKQVKDIFKLVNFGGSLNSQEIQVKALSDYDNDGLFEEESDVINLSDGTEIRSVSGFGNYSRNFRLNFTFSTSNASESPVLSQIDFKARKDPKITWTNSKPIKGFFEEQYGLYNVDYGAEDYGGNYQDTLLEESNFSVQDINIEADHTDKLDPGNQVNITGNATLITGDGSGGKDKQNFTGTLNILFEDTIRGQNQVEESRTFKNLKTGESREVPVNGSQTPQNAKITFFGKYSGVDEKEVWNESQDWDAYQSRTGMTHSSKEDSPLDNKSLTLGYSSQDFNSNSLEAYYSLDDSSLPANDSVGNNNFQETGSPETGAPGVVSTEAVRFSGSEGLEGSSPFSSTGSFTINAWVKPSSLPSSSGHLGSGTGDPYTVFAVEDKLTLQVTDGGRAYGEAKVNGNKYSARTDAGTVNADEWSMVTLRYNTGEDTLKVSTSKALLSQNEGTASFTTTPDLTGKQTYAGYRSDIGENSFKGKIDELRIYSRIVNPGRLINRIGESDNQQSITTDSKSFTETIKSGSLVLEADVETNGQDARVVVQSNQGGTSDSIKLSNDQEIYQITNLSELAQSYSLKVEMDGNLTHAPVVKDLRLNRRFATEEPGIDIDGDGVEEANYSSGRILPGQSQTETLDNLSTGVKTADFSTKNGEFDAEINYTEILVSNSESEVNINSSGQFKTNFTAPSVSRTSNIDYYSTNTKGIQGINRTSVTISLLFTSSNVSDLANGDRVIDPKDSFQVNASLAPITNPIDRVWGVIETEEGETYERDLSNSTYSGKWNFTEEIQEIFDQEGNYSVQLHANDTTGLTELKSPEVSFNVTNGTVSVNKNKQVVGLERMFEVSGYVRQSLTGEKVNASVNVTLPETDVTKELDTNSSGFYNTTLQAPSTTGTYPVEVRSIDENAVTASNTTDIEVESSTDFKLSVPEEKIQILGVTLEEGVNRTFEINVTNQGNTEIRNLNVFAEALPKADKKDAILEDRGGKDWKSVNRTYNISAGETKQVKAEVWVSEASTQSDYELNISAEFETTGGGYRYSTQPVTMSVITSKIPLFQNNLTVTLEDGYEGNWVPPGKGNSDPDKYNMSIVNEGTGTAENIGWTIENSKFRDDWNVTFDNPRDGEYDEGTGDSINIYEVNGLIPEGTPPGNYSTLLDVYSKDPQRTNEANLTVEVKDLPKFEIELLKLKDEVEIPEEVNESNPIDVGTMALDSKEDLFQLRLENTGNRDLEWEVKSYQTQGDDNNLFYANESAIPNHGSDGAAKYNSTIDSLEESRYEINSTSTSIGYTTKYSNDLPEVYSANISVQCTDPKGCTPQKVNIPVEGTIKNPPPEFNDIEIPNITGNGNSITINATVSDNKGDSNTEGLADVNITVTKYLNETLTEKRSIPISDLGVSGNIEETFNFDKNGWNLNSSDHTYGIRFEAADDEGNRRETEEYDVTVRDRGRLSFQFDEDPIVMDNVTTESGDTAYLRGNVTGGEVDVGNVEIEVLVDGSDIGDPSKVNVPDVKKLVNVGDVDANETIDIEREIVADSGIGSLPTYYTTVNTEMTHPDGVRLSGDNPPEDSTPDISIAANSIMSVEGSQTIDVEHNNTETGHINVSSAGNTEISNIEFECIGCQQELGITSYSDQGFDLNPGEERTIDYNVTADKFVEQTALEVDIKVRSDEKTEYLNSTFFNVPNDRTVNITPLKAEEAVPINQGTANLTLFQIKNLGNDYIEPVSIANPIDGAVYLGTNPNENLETDLAPGDTEEFRLRADTNSLQTTTDYTGLEINPDSGTNLDEWDVAEVDLFAQDIGFEILNINRTDSIKAGGKISVEFNLTQEDRPINESVGADFRLKSEDKEIQLDSSYTENDTWKSTFQAPDIEDGVSHEFTFEARSDAYRSSVSANTQVSYADVTPPRFVNLTAEPVTQNNASTISVKLKDNSNIPEGDVTATVQTPNGTIQQKLNNQSSEDLSEVDQKEWALEFTNTSEKGRYNVTITASDMPGNNGTSDFKIFRVFEPLDVKGDAVDPSEETKIELVDAGGDVAETINPVNKTYNQTIKSGTYEQADIQVDDDKVATVESIEASSINQSPPRFDADINDDFVQVDEKYLKGYALVSETFENVSGSTGFSYSDVVSEIDFQGNLQVLKCDDYNISSVNPCESGYEPLPSDDIGIDAETQTVAVEEIDGFSSYILVENTTSSEQNNLNVNLTGELGDLSDLSGLSGTLNEVASNTADLGNLDGGTTGDSTGGTSGTDDTGGASSGALDQIASQLNESDSEELAVGNSKISISVQPGQQKSTAVSIQNPKSEPVDIELQSTDNIADMVSYEKDFNLSAGEFRTVRISVNASNKTRLKEYSGFIQIKGGNTDRSIPVNIDIVGAENRLLDVTLEPTVDNFRPGKTARLKLSFSNQGFSRAVDAETTVEIVDITDDEVVAKKTHTYAVQTTLDKVVSLNIPEDTDLGTYEARASVGYSNIPGNRSATAVGQVEVERPFWQRKTLGLGNIYWLGILFLLIAAGSGGGYWYYRKKKLEAKRSRFEEQVDNDSIPSEAGRTAFAGELSEIGTRAFIDLNDLMTHCLTAGATGAGKSVAAQVIVEEALEKGVNVIVLDPTGQWSGYLDENENDEFFAFYDDFGMKEGDARSYEGNIRAVDADQDTIDITDIMRPDGDEGSIHVFSMHKLENAELEEYLSDTIQQIFDYNPEEKDELETMIVYDEAHRVLEKFGGTGRGVKMLERGAREFRKWGVGMLMISQVIDDFPEEVRANIGTQIQMRTEYEGDLDRIERKYGNNITQGVTKADTGTGMLQNSSYNHGRPYFVDFRPVKHSPERLSDEELDKFEKYNRRVDELEDMISILEDQDEDVFEYQSQLKLVKKNIRKRSFNLVDTYLDELEEDLNDALDL